MSVEKNKKIIFDTNILRYSDSSVLIITANQKDYPHPIFQEEDSSVISNKDKFNRTEYTSIYLLKPNYEFLEDKLITSN